MLVRIATWLGAALLCSATIAAMYRFAPDRADAEWRWLSVGSVLAMIVWLIATLGFGFYASRFGDYNRSEEHTSELQSLMRISYAVFCLKKKKYTHQI